MKREPTMFDVCRAIGGLFAALLLVAFVVAAFGCEPGPDDAKPNDSTPSVPVVNGPAVIGQLAPTIDANDFAGLRFTTADQRGKVVVVSFWGSFCKPCRAQVPHERKLVAKHQADAFTFVGVATDNPTAAVVASWGMTWRNLADPSDQITNAYVVTALPTTFVIDKAGVLRGRFTGGRPAEVDAMVTTLLAAK